MSRLEARAAAALLAALGLAGLVGCAASEQPEGSEPPSAPAETQTQTAPEPTPSETDGDGVESWTITPSGIGPLEIGMRYADALTVKDVPISETCTGVAAVENEASDVDAYLIASGNDPSGTVTEITVSIMADAAGEHAGRGPATAEGIGLGSTVSELEAAYPGVRELDDTGVEGRTMYYLESEGGGGMIFTTATDADAIWSISVTTGETPAYEPCA